MTSLRTLVETGPTNAALAWALVVALAASALASLAVGEALIAGYALVVVAVALVPPALVRDGTVVVAWQALAVAAVPVGAQWLGRSDELAAYLGVAALALLVAAEVDAFSSARMPPWFAVLFVVATTLTVGAAWGIVRYFVDVALGTSLLAGRVALMWDLTAATAAGVAAGLAFEGFFRVSDEADEATAEVGTR